MTITVEQMKTLDAGVGGIAGRTRYARLINCSNKGTVHIVSEGKGGITFYAGGLVGNASTNTKIQTSYNSGVVKSAHTAVRSIPATIREKYPVRSMPEV